MGLAVNVGKTKYMLTTSGVVPRMGSQIRANSYNFDVVMEFISLWSTLKLFRAQCPILLDLFLKTRYIVFNIYFQKRLKWYVLNPYVEK